MYNLYVLVLDCYAYSYTLTEADLTEKKTTNNILIHRHNARGRDELLLESPNRVWGQGAMVRHMC